MKLFHGSNTSGIRMLEPRLADHDRPYIYLTAIDVVAAFYLCNAVEKPWYWFPYGFENGNPKVPVYHELYPNALEEVSGGVRGCIYQVEASESQIIPFPNIPCARLGIEPLEVAGCQEVPDAFELFQRYKEQGKLKIGRFEDKSQKELNRWYDMLISYLEEKKMSQIPDCSYAKFIRSKFPFVWERYLEKSR